MHIDAAAATEPALSGDRSTAPTDSYICTAMASAPTTAPASATALSAASCRMAAHSQSTQHQDAPTSLAGAAATNTEPALSGFGVARSEAYVAASAMICEAAADFPTALSGVGNVQRARYSSLCRMMCTTARRSQRARQMTEHCERAAQEYRGFAEWLDVAARVAHKSRGPKGSVRSMQRNKLHKSAAAQKRVAQVNNWPTSE